MLVDPVWTVTSNLIARIQPAQGNGLWVAADYSDTSHVYVSPDGRNWSTHPLPRAVDVAAILFVGELFMVIEGHFGASSAYFTSPDGVTWIERAHPQSSFFDSASVANGGAFLCCRNSGSQGMDYTFDAINWHNTLCPVSAIVPMSTVYLNGRYFTYANNVSTVSYTDDLVNWTSVGGLTPAFPVHPQAGKNVVCCGGTFMQYSTDGINFHFALDQDGNQLNNTYAFAYDPATDQFITENYFPNPPYTGAIYYSGDGAHWCACKHPHSLSPSYKIIARGDATSQFLSLDTTGTSIGDPVNLGGSKFPMANYSKLIRV